MATTLLRSLRKILKPANFTDLLVWLYLKRVSLKIPTVSTPPCESSLFTLRNPKIALRTFTYVCLTFMYPKSHHFTCRRILVSSKSFTSFWQCQILWTAWPFFLTSQLSDLEWRVNAVVVLCRFLNSYWWSANLKFDVIVISVPLAIWLMGIEMILADIVWFFCPVLRSGIIESTFQYIWWQI